METLQQLPGFIPAVQVFLTLGVIYGVNRVLNQRALGNRTSTTSWDWTKEIILITGGSSGIGELMVRQFSRKNIKVVVMDIIAPRDSLPDGTLFYKVDITSPEAVHEAAEEIRRDVGAPTVIINNAGVGTAQSILDSTRAQIKRTFDVNVISHFWLIQEFLPAMIKQNHGHIVTVASMASFVTIAGNVDYSCSKSASLAVHEGLGQELKYRYNARNVRTSVIHPYWVRTQMIRNLVGSPNLRESPIEPEDVAAAVVKQVLSGQSGQIIIPRIHGLATGIRGWPVWLQEIIRGSEANTLKGITL